MPFHRTNVGPSPPFFNGRSGSPSKWVNVSIGCVGEHVGLEEVDHGSPNARAKKQQNVGGLPNCAVDGRTLVLHRDNRGEIVSRLMRVRQHANCRCERRRPGTLTAQRCAWPPVVERPLMPADPARPTVCASTCFTPCTRISHLPTIPSPSDPYLPRTTPMASFSGPDTR